MSERTREGEPADALHGTFVVGDQVLVLAMLARGHHHAVVVRHFRHHLGVPTAADLARVHHQKLLQLQMLRPPRRRDDLGLRDLAPEAFRGASGGVVGHAHSFAPTSYYSQTSHAEGKK